MGQQLWTWQAEGGERRWLVMLIDTMEQVARPEVQGRPCDAELLAAFHAHLLRTASAYPHLDTAKRH